MSQSNSSIGRLIKGNLFILLSTIFFGVNIPVVKILIPEWMSAVDVTVFRLGGGCVLMWIASVFIKTEKIERHDYLRICPYNRSGLSASSHFVA